MRARACFLALLGALLAAALAPRLGRLRWPGFAEALPYAPPVFHGVLEARSADGLSFAVSPAELRFPAETQHPALAADGGRLLFYFEGRRERLSLLDLGSGRVEALEPGGDCAAEPAPGVACVDPCWVALADGRQRLYYTAAPRGLDPALGGPVEIRSAVSADGRTWTREPGARLAGPSLVDPDVVRLPDGRFRLYVTSLLGEDGAPAPDGLPAVYSAISEDGLAFSREPGRRLSDASASATLLLPEGGFRTYYHPFAGGIASAVSLDGLSFAPEPGLRVPVDPLPDRRWLGSASPAALRLADGSIWLTFNAARRPPFPLDWLVALRYRRPER